MPRHSVTCDYCGKPTMLVTGERIYPRNEKVHQKHFWFCGPCDAWIGCHENSPSLKPVGRLADKELRKAKRDFHAAFDILYLAGFERLSRVIGSHVTRHDCVRIAYKWLAERMAINPRDCDPGKFDRKQVDQARKIAETLGNELLARYKSTADGVNDE